jgi:hypothetical protein
MTRDAATIDSRESISAVVRARPAALLPSGGDD